MKRRILLNIFVMSLLGVLFLDSCQSPEVTSAKVYFQQNNIPAAEEQLLIALEKEPMNPEVPFLLAVKVYMEQGEWLKAKKYLEKVIEIDPHYVYPVGNVKVDDQLKRLWAQVHTQGANLFNEAIKAILPIEKDSLLSEAADKFNLALEIRDTEAVTYNGLIKCYYMLEENDKIIELAEKARGKGIFDEDVMMYYTQALFDNGEKDKAVATLNDILTEHHDAIKLQEQRIQFLLYMDHLDEAREIAKELAAEYPTDVDIMYLLAFIYYKLGDFESAQYQFQKVLIENPDDYQVLHNIANSAFQAEDWYSAEEYARRMVELDPENPAGYQILWKALFNQGRREEAEEYRQIEKSLR